MVIPSAALLAGTASVPVYALGLGELNVSSRLNEPLRAEIPVKAATADELATLTVGLAGAQDWQRAGLSYSGAAGQIQFGYVARPGGNLSITLRTEQPITEPLVIFLVDAAWNSGQLLREYTVFLDPISYDSAAAPAPVAVPPQLQQHVQNNTQQRPPAAVVPPLSATASRWPSSHRVAAGESLSQIAERYVSGTDLSRNQIAWALYQANPAAFQNNNINLLESGARLSVPSQAAVAATSPSRAESLFIQAATRPAPAKSAADTAVTSQPSPTADAVELQTQAPLEQASLEQASRADALAEQPTPAEADATAAEDSPSMADLGASEPSVSSVDKLDLLPLEDDFASEDGAPPAPLSESDNANLSADGATLAQAADEAVLDERAQALASENAMLKERLSETEALLKEIRELVAARSAQISELQARLEAVESGKANSANAQADEDDGSKPIGWLWWLLLGVAGLIGALLMALLMRLTRRQEKNALVSRLGRDENADDATSGAAGGGLSSPSTPSATQPSEALDSQQQSKQKVSSRLAAPIAVGGAAVLATSDKSSDELSADASNLPTGETAKAEVPVAGESLLQPDKTDLEASHAPESESSNGLQAPILGEAFVASSAVAELDEVGAAASNANTSDAVAGDAGAGDELLEFDLDDYAAPAAKAEMKPEAAQSKLDDEAELAFEIDDSVLANADSAVALDDIDEPVLGEDSHELSLDKPSLDKLSAGEPSLDELSLDEVSLDNLSTSTDTEISAADVDLDDLSTLQEAVPAAEPEGEPDEVTWDDSDLAFFEAAEGEANLDTLSSPEKPAQTDNAEATAEMQEISADPVATKLDLAQIYIDMGETEEARSMLEEIVSDGNEQQQADAQKLLDNL